MSLDDNFRNLLRFAVSTDFDSIPRNVVNEAKNRFLDWVGVAMIGSRTEAATILSRTVRLSHSDPESTVVASQFKTSSPNAALLNGQMSHMLELDDIASSPGRLHPGAVIIPAVLATAEKEGLSGKEFLTSIVVGYEVVVRLGQALNPPHYSHLFHPTSTLGTVGASFAASKALGMNEKQTANAAGIAASLASGIRENFGTMMKSFHAGWAAHNGVISSILSKEGYGSAGVSAISGERGMVNAMTHAYDDTRLVNSLGENYVILRCMYKIHGSCGSTHPAIDAILGLVNDYNITHGDIKEIVVGVFPHVVDPTGSLLSTGHPNSPLEAKFNLKYCVATAAFFRRVLLDEFNDAAIKNPEISRLMDCTVVNVDPELAREGYYGKKCKGRITLNDGTSYENVVQAKGTPENPITQEDLKKKYLTLGKGIIPERRLEEIAEEISRIDSRGDISHLSALLS